MAKESWARLPINYYGLFLNDKYSTKKKLNDKFKVEQCMNSEVYCS